MTRYHQKNEEKKAHYIKLVFFSENFCQNATNEWIGAAILSKAIIIIFEIFEKKNHQQSKGFCYWVH
jgi:hypothetical protein